MKLNFSFYLVLLILSMFVRPSIGQKTRREVGSAENRTILWKISGKDCKQPSYLLGTFHLTDADWLYGYPEFKEVIASTEFILTEGFTTLNPDTASVKESKLKALPLLSNEQYKTLDSFFVARVGEGISNNKEAANMTVDEMGGAILFTLTYGQAGPNGVTKYMDRDLFTLYQKMGRSGDRLDRILPTEFNSDNVEHAKQHLARSLNYIKNSDKPDWNIYQTKGVDKIVADYKAMKVEYNLTDSANFDTSNDFDFIPMEVRNREWMNKITSNISKNSCLIAVGLAHLRYRIGLINLLRGSGYIVEPVIFSTLH